MHNMGPLNSYSVCFTHCPYKNRMPNPPVTTRGSLSAALSHKLCCNTGTTTLQHRKCASGGQSSSSSVVPLLTHGNLQQQLVFGEPAGALFDCKLVSPLQLVQSCKATPHAGSGLCFLLLDYFFFLSL